MKRRDVIALFAGATLATPFIALAQRSSRIFRVGAFPDVVPELLDWLSADMRDLGWTEGRDFIVVQSEYKVGDPQLDEAAQRMVANKPDLILTRSTAHALALHRVTASIPIVMLTSGYPVEVGLADSLAKPGKNVTGNTIYAGTEVWGKLLQLLRDAKPDVERVGILWTYVPPAFAREEIEPCYAELRSAGRSFGLKLHTVEVANPDQVQAALAEIEAEKPQGLLLTSFSTLKAMSVITQFAVDRRLPTIIDLAWTLELVPYPLLSYGPVYRELVRSAVASIDKILRGSEPGDLPIQHPARFEMVVSQKTAKAISLDLPLVIFARADRVIE